MYLYVFIKLPLLSEWSVAERAKKRKLALIFISLASLPFLQIEEPTHLESTLDYDLVLFAFLLHVEIRDTNVSSGSGH